MIPPLKVRALPATMLLFGLDVVRAGSDASVAR